MINDEKPTSHSSPIDENLREDDILSITMQQTRCKLPSNRPKPSGSALKHWEYAVQSDNDLWVEHSYKNKHGQDISYYCSMLTRKCQLLEPPTGAATILYQEDIAADPTLRCRVPGPLPMEQLRGLSRPGPSLHLEADAKKNAASYGTAMHGARTLIARLFPTQAFMWRGTPKGMLLQVERPGMALEL